MSIKLLPDTGDLELRQRMQEKVDEWDYRRLIDEEGRLAGNRNNYRLTFVALALLASTGYGIAGINGAVIVIATIPFFLMTMSLEMCHDKHVLRCDTRRGLKRIARRWNVTNHDMCYSLDVQSGRWYHGLFQRARMIEYVGVQLTIACGVCLHLPVYMLALAGGYVVMIVVTIVAAW